MAGIQADANRYAAQQSRMGSENVARTNAAASRYGADAAAGASRHGSNMQYRAASEAEQGRNRRFDSRMALLDQYMPQVFDVAGSMSPFSIGGSATGQPAISGAPVYTPQQIAARRADIFARNQQQAASQSRQAANEMAGRGVGGNSPLLQALQTSFQNSALARSGDQSLQWELGAAEQNANNRLAGGIARENQFAARRGEQLQAQSNLLNYQTNLLGALASMVGGI